MNIKKSAGTTDDPPQPTPEEPPKPPRKRKRGAQPGNKNAVKHGFYTERGIYTPPVQNKPSAPHVPELTPEDSPDNKTGITAFGAPDNDLDTKWEKIKAWLDGEDERPFLDLQLEIDVMRMAIRHVVSMPQPQSLDEAIQLIRALSLASSSLARLIRTQYYVTPPISRQETWKQASGQALEDIAKELDLRV